MVLTDMRKSPTGWLGSRRRSSVSSLIALMLLAGACSHAARSVSAAPEAGTDTAPSAPEARTDTAAPAPEAGTGIAFLAPEAVTGLPPGNAAAKTLWANLQVQTTSVEVCQCRTGSCTAFPDLPFILVLHTDDGSLDLTQNRGGVFPKCSGGADADGRFWCGVAEPDGSLHLIKGQISWAANGVDSVRLTKKETLHRIDDGLGKPVDCDVEESGTFKILR